MFHVPAHKNLAAPAGQFKPPVAKPPAKRPAMSCPACGGSDHASPVSLRCPCSAASGM